MHIEKVLSQCFLKARLLFPRDLEIRLIGRSHFLSSLKRPFAGFRVPKAWPQSGPQDPISPGPFDHSTSPNPRNGYEHLFGGGGFNHVAALLPSWATAATGFSPCQYGIHISPTLSVSSASGSRGCLVSSCMSFLGDLHTLLRALTAPAHRSTPLPGFPQSVSCSGQ